MKRDSVVAIVAALNGNQVQYLIVGGLAVVAHGYVRFTADVDLLLSVDPDNLKRTVEALNSRLPSSGARGFRRLCRSIKAPAMGAGKKHDRLLAVLRHSSSDRNRSVSRATDRLRRRLPARLSSRSKPGNTSHFLQPRRFDRIEDIVRPS